MASKRLDKHDIHVRFHVQMSLQSLNDYVVAKQTFNIFILRFFRANSIVFISSSVGFSNEDNCCQSQGIKKLIKKKLLKYFQS